VLPQAVLNAIDLSTTTLTGVVSGSVTGTPTQFPTNWRLIAGYLVGPGADLGGANLSNQDLTGIDAEDANVTNANFTGSLLNSANLARAVVEGANFTDVTFQGVISGGLVGTPSVLPAGFRVAAGYLAGPGVNLANADLSGITLAGLDLSGATLTGVRSSGVTGTAVALPTHFQVLAGHLVGPGVDLSQMVLSQLSFAGVDLTGANLKQATLTGASFAAATMVNVKSGGVIGTPTSLPPGWVVVTGGYLAGPGANLGGANFADVDLSGIDLSSANLAGVSSGNTTTPAQLPTSWRSVAGYLIGPGANLTGANLTGVNLTGAVLANATLSGASFTSANLTGVLSGGVQGVPSSLPTGWGVSNGYLN
jgi:uncharacterized protein YjbI with pentapeptide repeats